MFDITKMICIRCRKYVEKNCNHNDCKERMEYLKKLINYYLNELKDAGKIETEYIRPRLFEASYDYNFLKTILTREA